MSLRGMAIVLLALAGPAAGKQESKLETGKYKLSVAGKDTGVEEFRLEEFDDGKVVLFAKAKFELELSGARRAYLTDTVLTMDKSFAPLLYAGYRKAGRDYEEQKPITQFFRNKMLDRGKLLNRLESRLVDWGVLKHAR